MDNLEYTEASEIILPSGSTSTELQAAINAATSGDTIIICGDMPFTDDVEVPEEKEITIRSDAENNHVMSQPNTNIRHFSVAGMLILRDVTLDGMHGGVVPGGGGIDVTDGELILAEGTVLQNCYRLNSGGVILITGGSLTMNGSTVKNNINGNNGGGIFLTSLSSFIMNYGIITNNIAEGYGGGIYLTNSSFTMNGGILSDNTAGGYGGGIFALSNTLVTINGGTISDNEANNGNGGGIYNAGSLQINENSHIINNRSVSYGGGIYTSALSSVVIANTVISSNTALTGGGIYTANSIYSNLNIDGTIFACNKASTAYNPPPDATTQYPNIRFAGTTITDHPLNNYDINYMIGEDIDATFCVTYDANGGIGNHTGPSVDPCDTDMVLSVEDTGITRPGYTFSMWNTASDGSGDFHVPGDEIIVSGDISLYAQWVVNLHTVIYDANGGNGGYTDYIEHDSLYRVLSLKETGIGYTMYTLDGWNTQSDGTGVFYTPGDTFIINGDVTLYAQWRKITRDDVINLMLVSVAMEELGLSHILNTQGEELQYVLGTQHKKGHGEITICDIMEVNKGLQRTLRDVIKTNILVQINPEDE